MDTFNCVLVWIRSPLSPLLPYLRPPERPANINHRSVAFVLTSTLLSGVHHLEEIVQAGLETPAINQVELHPFCQQRPITEYCTAHNIIVQAYCPLMRGQGWDNPVLKEVAEKHGKEVGHILLRWSLQKGYVFPSPHSFSTRVSPHILNCSPFKLFTPP